MHSRAALVITCLAIASFAAARPADADLITFDNVTDGTVINNLYSGVTFSNPLGGNIYARSDSSAISVPNVVSVFLTGFPVFDATFGAVQANFATPQLSVSIDTIPFNTIEPLGTPLNRPFLEAFSTSGQFLGEVLYQGALPDVGAGPVETLTFTSTTANIGAVLFSSQQSQGGPPIYGLFDNLAFTSVAVAVPEPSSVTMVMGIGVLGLLGYAWRHHRAAA